MNDTNKKIENIKPESAKPALKQPRWPGLGGNHSGLKGGKSVHDRKPIGRGSSRGR